MCCFHRVSHRYAALHYRTYSLDSMQNETRRNSWKAELCSFSRPTLFHRISRKATVIQSGPAGDLALGHWNPDLSKLRYYDSNRSVLVRVGATEGRSWKVNSGLIFVFRLFLRRTLLLYGVQKDSFTSFTVTWPSISEFYGCYSEQMMKQQE